MTVALLIVAAYFALASLTLLALYPLLKASARADEAQHATRINHTTK